MNLTWNLGTEAVGAPRAPADLAEAAASAETDGFAAAWTVHFSRGLDAVTALTFAGTRTTTIELGVGVVPIHPRHPVALAQQALTAQAAVGGRLVLGVGVSHRAVVEGVHGLSYRDLLAHLEDYLRVLVPLVQEGRVAHAGPHYRVDVDLTIPGTAPVPVVVAALSPGTARLAGGLADGAVTWLAGPRVLSEVIAPTLHDAAAAAGRASPRIVAAVPVAVTPDVVWGREAATRVFARYGALPNYRRVLAREGVEGPADVAVVGPVDAVRDGLQAYADAGVTDLWAIPFPAGPDPAACRRKTEAVLRDLARSRSGATG